MRNWTVDGDRVVSASVFREGGRWRWRINTAQGMEHLDGGNYLSEAEARSGLHLAVDRVSSYCLRIPSALWRRAKIAAAERGVTIRSVLETALRDFVDGKDI